MNIRRLRVGLCAAVVAVLAVPSGASAQEGDDIFAQTLAPLYHVQSGTYEYTGTAGGPNLFTLAASTYNNTANSQAVVGTFSSAVFAGVIFTHDYDARADHGKYHITGMVDPTGLAPPVPLDAFLTAMIDRNAATWVLSISGTIGGRSFSGSTPPLVNPFYSPF